MVKASELVYRFNEKFNRFSGGEKKGLKIQSIMLALNEALEIYFENLVDFAEENSKTRDALRPLEVKNCKLSDTKDGDSLQDIYELKDEIYRVIRVRVIANRNGCPDKAILPVKIQSDDTEGMLADEYWQSSYDWEQVLYDESSQGLHFYHQGNLNIKSVSIDYYRRPKTLHAPSMTEDNEYEDWCGVIQKRDCNLELDRVFEARKIVDLAIIIARINAGDSVDLQQKIREILFKQSLQYK